LSDHLHAVALAASVPGVQRVAREIQSPDTLADAEIWREPTPPKPSAADGVGAAAREGNLSPRLTHAVSWSRTGCSYTDGATA